MMHKYVTYKTKISSNEEDFDEESLMKKILMKSK